MTTGARRRIELFGGMQAILEGRTLTRFGTQKAAHLLAYLALTLPKTHLREHLLDLFWPDLPPHAGRDNLSTTLSTLRRCLEPPPFPAGTVLVADRHHVGLNPHTLTTDVADFAMLLAAADQSPSLPEIGRASCRERV